MARITVEDCVDKVPNRFELVMLASHRSRELSSGAELTIDRDNDKNPVVSLREIASGGVTQADLQERFIRTLQKINPNESEEEEFSKEDEFAAYINETTLSTEKEITVSSSINHSSSRNEDEIFEDVSDEIVRKEE